MYERIAHKIWWAVRFVTDIFLCATPLQAVIARAVVNHLEIQDYHVVYSTRRDSETDRRYAEMLASGTTEFGYSASVNAKFQLIRYMKRRWQLRRFFVRDEYRRIFVASTESLLFLALIDRNPRASLYTFDDGAANLLAHSKLRTARQRIAGWRLHLGRCVRPVPLASLITRHYSIYKGFENIVEPARVTYIDPWRNVMEGVCCDSAETTSFFIGQPYEDAIGNQSLTASELQDISTWLKTNIPDHYLQHPREVAPLQPATQHKSAPNLIAEERIFQIAAGRRPVIYSWFSTVLFNIGPEYADKFYLSTGRGDDEAERIRLVEKAGCIVIRLRSDTVHSLM